MSCARLSLGTLVILAAAACGDDEGSSGTGSGGSGGTSSTGTSASTSSSSPTSGTGAGSSSGTSTGQGDPTASSASAGGTTSTSSSSTTSTGSGGFECEGGAYDTCSTCCGAAHPAGVALFEENLQQCACGLGMCQFKCAAYCDGGGVDEACMENIAWNYNSPSGATSMGLNFGACEVDAECNAYGTCLMECTVGRGPIPQPAEGTSPQEACVYYVNAYRAWEGLPPLARWADAEACVDGQIEHDSMTQPHDWFGMCGESTQNECYGFGPDRTGYCAAMLYSEKFTGDQGMGHYLAMTGAYTELACGFYQSAIAQDYR